ncbi:MAG: hypothetical protein ACRCZ9_00680 [Fusobacteriaceae bacterium]
MGSNVAPAFEFIHVSYEVKMFKAVKKPLLYKRYLDDILVMVSSEQEFL